MHGRRGAVTVEFTLVGIPLIFALISIVEMSRGMWIYHTQSDAVNTGARYAVVHGVGCTTGGNSCSATVGSIATVIANAGYGLLPGDWNVTLSSASGTNDQTCNPPTITVSNS